MGTVKYDMTTSDMINSLIVQIFLVATIVVLLMISVEPRSSLVPLPLLRLLTSGA